VWFWLLVVATELLLLTKGFSWNWTAASGSLIVLRRDDDEPFVGRAGVKSVERCVDALLFRLSMGPGDRLRLKGYFAEDLVKLFEYRVGREKYGYRLGGESKTRVESNSMCCNCGKLPSPAMTRCFVITTLKQSKLRLEIVIDYQYILTSTFTMYIYNICTVYPIVQ
jgi:hypothetical protein